jgi:glycosyltransferase involved in cell wall biosynthesis
MRVLHVIPSVAARYGGPSTAVVPMCTELGRRQVETLLVTTNADGDRRLPTPIGQKTEWMGIAAVFFERRFSESFKYAPDLARWLNEHVQEFDLVHIHAVLSHACLSAASACKKRRVPYVIRPLGTLAPWSLSQKPLKKKLLLSLGARAAVERAAAVHCTSPGELRALETLFPGAHGVVVPLGVDDELFERKRESSSQAHDPYVLVVSRIHRKKNLEALVEAFLTANDGAQKQWRLVIAGDGDGAYVEALRKFVHERDRDHRVSFAGWVDGDRKRTLIEGASLFALVSFHENFGVSVLEALALGAPAIVSSAVDLADEIDREGAGWIVETSVASIRAGLEKAMNDPADRQQRSAAARQLAKRFAWSRVASDLVDLYRQVLQQATVGHVIGSSVAVTNH